MKRRRVVDAVSQIANDMTAMLERNNDSVLLGWRDSREDRCLLDDLRQGGVTYSLELVAEDDASNVEANLRADVLRHELVVASQDFEQNGLFGAAALD